MSLRPLALLTLAALLAGCTSKPQSPPPQEPAPPPKMQQSVRAKEPGALPSYLRELTGRLHGAPANSEVELALLLVDDNERPRDLVAVAQLDGTGQPLPFNLRFAPRGDEPDVHLELRGRVSQSGRLIMRLPAQRIPTMDNQALGDLRLVPAP